MVLSYHDSLKNEDWWVMQMGKSLAAQADETSAPNQFTQIPFQVKALKLLLKDVQTTGPKGGSKGKARDVNVEEDDGVRHKHGDSCGSR